jgi:hypothetical protein
MIEELKLILDAIGDLTGVALWVVAGFLAFKLITYLATTGAVVILVRLGIVKAHDIFSRMSGRVKVVRVRSSARDICIRHDGTDDRLIAVLHRLRRRPGSSATGFLHSSDVDWLSDAVAEKMKRENVPE